MDMEDFFSESSEGLLAILAGIAIIITISFFVYVVGQHIPDEPILFVFPLVAVIVGALAPISFYISELTTWPDLIGKLVTGITIAILVVLIINMNMSYEVSDLIEVLLSGVLGLSSSLLLVRGVLVPIYGEEMEFESSGSSRESFGESFDEEIEEDFETEEEDMIEERGSVEDVSTENESEEEKFPEEENEPW